MEAIPLCDIMEVYIYIFIFIYIYLFIYLRVYTTIFHNIYMCIYLLNYCQFTIYSRTWEQCVNVLRVWTCGEKSFINDTPSKNARFGESSVQGQFPTAV